MPRFCGACTFMRAVVQRVSEASVETGGKTVASMGRGVVALIGLGVGDTGTDMEYIAQKIINLRIFDDANGVMNLTLGEIDGGLLLVSQFTLYGDARKGRRPSYSCAMPPAEAAGKFAEFTALCRSIYPKVHEGVFGADMSLQLINEGPVTILLDSSKIF